MPYWQLCISTTPSLRARGHTLIESACTITRKLRRNRQVQRRDQRRGDMRVCRTQTQSVLCDGWHERKCMNTMKKAKGREQSGCEKENPSRRLQAAFVRRRKALKQENKTVNCLWKVTRTITIALTFSMLLV